jgi:hypothetical protein
VDITRRQLVALGAAGAAGAIVGKASTPEPASAAEARQGGIHIYCLLRGERPDTFKGFPYSVMFTLYGADNALNGMGWGATTEGGDPVQSYLGSSMMSCVFAAQGSVEGDLVKLKAVQILTAGRFDQGLPWRLEASLATGDVHAIEFNAERGTEIVGDGKGVVVRI